MTLAADQIAQLLKPINGARVLADGKGHAHVSQQDILAHLIRVFGFGSFDIQVLAVECIFEQERANAQGEGTNRFDVCYRALIRLTIRDREGQQVCQLENGSTATAQNQTRGDAHDLAYKSAISLSVKRAAIALGDQFGLSLYNKGQRTALVRGIVGLDATSWGAHLTSDVQAGIEQQVALGNDETDVPLESDHRPAERIKAAPPDDPFYDTPPRPAGARQASGKAVGKINALLTDLQIVERDRALAKVNEIIAPAVVASRNELTSAQASKVIKALESDLEQPFPAPPEPEAAP